MKYYIAAIISFIALLFYSLPWSYGATHGALGFYIIAFLWFMVLGWIVLIVQLYFFVLLRKRNNPKWKHHLIGSSLIGLSYIGFLWGLSNGYIVTV